LTLFFKQGNSLDRGLLAFPGRFCIFIVFPRVAEKRREKDPFPKRIFLKKKSCWGGKLLSSHGVMAVLNFDSVKLASDSV
jgi:hypothetical protein